MANEVLMPRLSDEMETGIIVEWKVAEGDSVENGDILAEIETEKTTMDLEASESGILLKKMAKNGEEVPPGRLIGVIGAEGEDITGFLEKEEEEESSPSVEKETEEMKVTPGKNEPAGEAFSFESDREANEIDSEVRISPAARRMARDHGIDIERLEGSGAEGRIVKRDLEQVIEEGLPPRKREKPDLGTTELKSEKIKLDRSRREAAKRLQKSKQKIPHFYLEMEVDCDRLVEIRKEYKALERDLSYNDFILMAAARALASVPELNSSYCEEFIQRYEQVDLEFAVAAGDSLVKPVIKSAAQKTIFEIHEESCQLINKARSGDIQPGDYRGGTFTVSNLGMHGVDNFAAVISPDQAGVLATGAIKEKPVLKEEELEAGYRMQVTLSCDQRVVDGVRASNFLREFKKLIENPVGLI